MNPPNSSPCTFPKGTRNDAGTAHHFRIFAKRVCFNGYRAAPGVVIETLHRRREGRVASAGESVLNYFRSAFPSRDRHLL